MYQAQLDRYYSLLASHSVPDSVASELEDDEDEVLTTITELEADNALIRHVDGVIRREYLKMEEGTRQEPLCGCDDPLCRLKSGELPTMIQSERQTDHLSQRSPTTRLSRFMERHTDPVVVREAHDEWLEMQQSVQKRLRRMITRIKQHRDSTVTERYTNV